MESKRLIDWNPATQKELYAKLRNIRAILRVFAISIYSDIDYHLENGKIDVAKMSIERGSTKNR